MPTAADNADKQKTPLRVFFVSVCILISVICGAKAHLYYLYLLYFYFSISLSLSVNFMVTNFAFEFLYAQGACFALFF